MNGTEYLQGVSYVISLRRTTTNFRTNGLHLLRFVTIIVHIK